LCVSICFSGGAGCSDARDAQPASEPDSADAGGGFDAEFEADLDAGNASPGDASAGDASPTDASRRDAPSEDVDGAPDVAFDGGLDGGELLPQHCPVDEEDPTGPNGPERRVVSGDLRIDSRADLASVARGVCLKIEGSVIIEDADDLVSLEDVAFSVQIGGSLVVRDNAALERLLGDSAITSIGGGVIIDGNPMLARVSLDYVHALGGDLLVRDNPRLTHLGWLHLKRVEGKVVVERNATLSEVEFNDLRRVDGVFRVRSNLGLRKLWAGPLRYVGGSLIVDSNAALTELKLNLPFLNHVGGDLRVAQNPALSACRVDALAALIEPTAVGGQLNFEGNDETAQCSAGCMWSGSLYLSKPHDIDVFGRLGCTTVDGRLVIEDSSLTNLDGLESLRRVTGGIHIIDNAHLREISGLANLEQALSVTVAGNDKLETLNAFMSLELLGGWRRVYIGDNPSLTDLRGLGGRTFMGWLIIVNNDSLASLSDLHALESATRFVIQGNDGLVDLRGLENFKHVSGWCGGATFGGKMSICANANLESLDGLENLETVGSSLQISSNPSLTDVSALSRLESIGGCYGRGGLWIFNNDALRDFEGLSLDSVISVAVVGNDSLESLRGFETVTSVRRFIVRNNDSLRNLEGLENLD
jgi:hypothetical protein